MDVIKNYVDGLFLKMPNTQEMREAKETLERRMQARYQELVSQGKSESEALGIVFGEYGTSHGQGESFSGENPYKATPAKNSNGHKKSSGNKVLDAFMSVYWLTIVCVYLCWSFLTYDWYITWIIWPISAVVRGMIYGIFFDKGGN